MSDHSASTTTLNTLIATLLDSVAGFTKSAQDVQDRDLAQRFSSRAQERQSAVAGLQSAVAQLGGTPEDETSTMGGIHRTFLNLKEAVTGTDDKTILDEVERGEDYLKEKFETALKADDLAPEARSAITTAWTSVKSGHDEMSSLKHSRERTESYRDGQQDAAQEYASESGTRR